jgi:membrane protein implicated in regulation of membrane protease activity
MFGFELVHIYAGCLLFGLGYALIAVLLGQMGGDHGGGDAGGDGVDGVDVGHAGDAGDAGGGGHDGHGSESGGEGGLSPFSPLMLATFATLFGGLGLVATGLFQVIPIVPANVAGVVGMFAAAALSVVLSSYLSFFLVRLFVKSETSSNISSAKLIGREAEVSLEIEPGRTGEVTYLVAGSRQSSMARLAEGVAATIKSGQVVEIVSIVDHVMLVKPAEKIEPFDS